MRRSDSWENIVTKRKRTCLAPGKKKKRGGNIDVQWNAFYTLFQDQTALSRNDDVKDQQQLLLRPYTLYIRQVCALLQHICNKRINLILFPKTGQILRREHRIISTGLSIQFLISATFFRSTAFVQLDRQEARSFRFSYQHN